jgi:hypothetical protein
MIGRKAKKNCDHCGKEHGFKRGRQNGSKCVNGHFICPKCQRRGLISSIIFGLFDLDMFDRFLYKRKCPVCNGKLKRIEKNDLITA